MIDRINQDAWKIKKLMRETEALSDEMLIALSALKGAMLKARQNPEIEVHTGQAALLHLTQAEQLVTKASNQLFRTHSALSDVARETAGVDEDIPTERVPSGTATSGRTQSSSAVARMVDANP